MQLGRCYQRVPQPAQRLAAMSYRSSARFTTTNEPDHQAQQSSQEPSSNEHSTTPQHGSIKPVHVSIDHDLEQPTAADAAREEEEYGLNTPAPGKGENNSSSNSGNSSGSNCWSGGSSSSSSSS